MVSKTDQVKVIVFCGGRGSANLTHALLKHPQISLNLIVNAYDDGLSTGKLRQLIPGMLGPSDVRKNISRIIEESNQPLSQLMDFRYPASAKNQEVLDDLNELFNWRGSKFPQAFLPFQDLRWHELIKIKEFLQAFLDYFKEKQQHGLSFEFADCSIGNIFFAGCFLLNNKNFNQTVQAFSLFCGIEESKVLNVTEGENFVLVGLKNDGELLVNESEIVGPQSSNLFEIFLLENYLTVEQMDKLRLLNTKEKAEQLRAWEKLPKLNPMVKEKISTADVIIYGPGTQYSSLFPSYLTSDIAETIVANINAEKIFVSNILQDHDIKNEDANNLVHHFLFYMNRKGQLNFNADKLVGQFFFQQGDSAKLDSSHSEYVHFDQEKFEFPMEKVKLLDWEAKEGKHSGGLVLDEILGLIQDKYAKIIKNYHHTISIIVPSLNEEKTVAKVLHDLSLLDFLSLGLEKDIIFVDGGSIDKTFSLAQKESGIRVFQLPRGSGRGEALRLGLEKSKGNIIVFFPSDSEYKSEDIYRVIGPIINEEAKVVLGSRAIKCLNLDKRILGIYGSNKISYLVSKYGGMLLSILTLLLYNRYISDTLTTLKAFRRDSIRKMIFKCKGVDFDLEILANLCINGEYILEIPVDYFPRTKAQGKKISLFDGIKALLVLFKQKWTQKRSDEDKVVNENKNLEMIEKKENNYEKTIHNHPRV